jgi:hypothetical protein
MTTIKILTKLDLAIQSLFSNDINLLQRELNERSIANKLTEYLQPLFNGFNVDNEYNGDIFKPNDRKSLDIAANKIREIGHTPNVNNNYRFIPDIIIHVRERNDRNLVVIEIKKDSSDRLEKEFDLVKLEHMTIDYLGNHYNYKLGIAIVLNTGVRAGTKTETFYQNGIRIDNRQDLS